MPYGIGYRRSRTGAAQTRAEERAERERLRNQALKDRTGAAITQREREALEKSMPKRRRRR